jgi:hypothetical protein
MSKKITSPTATRILLGAMGKMGEDSSRFLSDECVSVVAFNAIKLVMEYSKLYFNKIVHFCSFSFGY